MNYIKFPLGQQTAGQGVKVTLSGVESEVFLVDQINYSRFSRGEQYRRFGGLAKRSPVVLAVPQIGNWTVVVVPIGGRVTAEVKLVRVAA